MKITSKEHYNNIALDYDQMLQGPYWDLCREIIWNYIKEILPTDIENSHTLDAGGGTGLWAIKAASLGYRVTLVDISENMLAVARKKIAAAGLSKLIALVESDILNMPQFADDSFDLCFAEGDPVGYCRDSLAAIRELARVCKPGGLVAVSVDSKVRTIANCIRAGRLDLADAALRGDIGFVGAGSESYFECQVFTIEELELLLIEAGIIPIKRVGRPVVVTPEDRLDDPEVYKQFLRLELKYSSLHSLAGAGGHIVVVGKKAT